MKTRSGTGVLAAGLVAATLTGAAVVGAGLAELTAAARRVAPIAQPAAPGRPGLVETLVVVGRRPGHPATLALPRELTVSLSLGADGAVSQVRAVSDAHDAATLDAFTSWLASQRYAAAAPRQF